MNNNQTPPTVKKQGSTKNIYLVAVLVVAAAAVAGGAIWRSNHKSGVGKPASNSPTIPANWAEYKATKYEFMFNYPKSWSAPKIDESTLQGLKQDEVIFGGNSKTAYSVVTTMTSDAAGAATAKLNIQKTLAGDKKNFFKYDGGSYSTALIDPTTKSIGQVNIFQIVNLPKLKVSSALIEVLLNPSSKCAGGKLAASNTNGCFSEADYTAVSQFAKSIRPL